MDTKWFAISALALSLGATTGAVTAKAYAMGTPLPGSQGYQEGQGRWDQPPSEYREAKRQGYHDGIEAARRDFERHHMKDADDHEMFRHPHVEEGMRDEYREGFRSGYQRAAEHLKEEHHDHDGDGPRF